MVDGDVGDGDEGGGDTSDAGAIRMAGIVLSAIGCLAMIIITGWNALTDYPALDSLVSISGTVRSAGVETVSTRTAVEKWIVINVDPGSGSALTEERWIFPRHSELVADQVTSLQVGTKVSGLAIPEPQRLRWSDDPVRVIWSLSDEVRELVSYDNVVGVELAAQHQSPLAGLILLGLGVFIVISSRMRNQGAR
jgi:hypothetical protein